MKARLFALLMLLLPLPFASTPVAYADMQFVHRRVDVEMAQENEQRQRLLERLRALRGEQPSPAIPKVMRQSSVHSFVDIPPEQTRALKYVGDLIVFAAVVAAFALLAALTKNTPKKRRPGMTDTSSTAFETSQDELKVANAAPITGSHDQGLEKWRDAALFFAVTASSCFVFSKLGFKAISLCGSLGSALARSSFDPFWIVRVFAALFVGSIVVYLFQRLAKDTERDLKNSLAGNIALAFMCLALLVSHAEGLYLVSVTPCGRAVDTF